MLNISILKYKWWGVEVKSYLPYDEKKDVIQKEDNRGIRGIISSG
nr:MAG TPA: hypothetical protein [Caudoviricetes sp.]